MSDLILLLSDCIGQITRENQILVHLSGLGFLHLREQLFKHLTSNCEAARCVLNNEKQRCINNVEKYIASVIKKEFSFGKKIQSACGNFLENSTLTFYQTLSNSLKQALPKVHPPP